MSEKGLYSPVIRRIITIVALLGVIGSFVAAYYFIYVPQAKMLYNLQNFRILHEISNNFKDRVDNYGTAYSSRFKNNQDSIVPALMLDTGKFPVNFNSLFRSSFKGYPTVSQPYNPYSS